jgi:hypothetical protein
MHATLVRRIVEALFEHPVMQNDIRSIYVEHMVAELLGKPWRLVSDGWAGWDLEGPGETRVEVKQSAARQTWSPPTAGRAKPSFDIEPRNGYWQDGSKWIAQAGRHANIYVFCWHPIESEACDQRDPEQWTFYVVPSPALPPQKSISLGPLSRLTQPISSKELRGCLDTFAAVRTAAAAR